MLANAIEKCKFFSLGNRFNALPAITCAEDIWTWHLCGIRSLTFGCTIAFIAEPKIKIAEQFDITSRRAPAERFLIRSQNFHSVPFAYLAERRAIVRGCFW